LSGSTEKRIFIKAQSKSNGITSSLIGVGAIILGLTLTKVLPAHMVILGFIVVSIGIVACVIGFYKIKEPNYSVMLDDAGIHYQHRYGKWFIAWENIQRIDTPRVTRGVELVDLRVVGVKLKAYPEFLGTVSQRLMANILMEQRPLLMHNADPNCTTGMCGGEDIVAASKYKLPDGTVLTGVRGLFVNRMQKLRGSLGFDVYINEAELDRDVGDFVGLLRACQADIQASQVHNSQSTA
jgi:hypothetical protein